MPTIGSMTKTIRFNPSDLGKIESVMDKENTTFNNAVHILIEGSGGTPKEKKAPSKSEYELIDEMASLMRVETNDLLRIIRDMLEEGTLYYSNGKLINPVYEDFENAFTEEQRERILEKAINDYGK